MQRSSPALFDSLSFSPTKKRSLLRREPNVADDNDDTRELLLAACREGECGHRHHRYSTSNTTNSPHSPLSKNLPPRPPARDPTALQDTENQKPNHHPHHQYHLLNDGKPQAVKQQQVVPPPQQRPPPQQTPTHHQQPLQPPAQQNSPPSPHDQQSQPKTTPSSTQFLSKPREHAAIRQCSAPTPLYPSAYRTGQTTGPIQQQHSFPEWSRPHHLLPLYPQSGTHSPPLSAAAAAAPSPSYSASDDLRHPAAANSSLLMAPGGGDGHHRHANGDSELAAELGGREEGWVLHRQVKPAAFLNNNNTAAAAIATPAMDSQGPSRTPDSPLRSGDDEGVAEDDQATRGEAAEFRDSGVNHVSRAPPPPLPPLLPRDLPTPLYPFPSPDHRHPAASDTTLSETEAGQGDLEDSGQSGTEGVSTSTEGLSLLEDDSPQTVTDSSLAPPSPTAPHPSGHDEGTAHKVPMDHQDSARSPHSPHPEPPHSGHHTADFRASSSEAPGCGSSWSAHAPQPSPQHLHAAEGQGERGGGAEATPSPSASPDNLLYPDASG